jgi:uronate dehydrogenase
MKSVLITGAAGHIGRYLRTTMRDRYRLRLSDIRAPRDLEDEEDFVEANVADVDAMCGAVEGMHGIVHLGAVSAEDAWEPILAANIIGTYNVYEAARRQGVERVVFASSNHAVGFYPRSQTVGVDVTVRPDSRYGVSKAYGEALASLYADKYGVRSLCLRIGNVADEPIDVRRLSIWLSPRDLTQLIEIGLEHPDVRFEVVYGMSDNQRAWWDNSAATRLGYAPRDRSEDYAQAVLARCEAPGDSLPDRMQGGDFVVLEKGGSPFVQED